MTTSRPASRALWAAVAITVLVVVAGVTGLPGTAWLRSGGGMILGPLERAFSPGREDDLSRLTVERDQLAQQLREARTELADQSAVADLLAAPAIRGASVLPARVVAVGTSGPSGPERATLDVGSRDGVVANRTVVSANGLVGRVVSVAPWTCDVALLSAPEVAVGVRVGPEGILGSVRSAAGGLAGPRDPGQLSLELIGQGRLRVGDEITTLGSVDGAPFAAGVKVGTLARIDPARGRLAASGAVKPAVDLARISVVGVVLTTPRQSPRPSSTGAAQ